MNWARTSRKIVNWSLKWGFPILLASGSATYGYKKGCIDPMKKGSLSHKILPPPGGRMYNGAWINHTPDPAHLLCFEDRFGERVDIAYRYQNFTELRTDKPFPVAEAEAIRDRGGSMFIALEPWMGRGGQSMLADIANGRFDTELENYGKSAAAYNGPVFLAFGPGMNEGPEPWTNQPELFVKAYKRVHEQVSKFGRNITWVWNVNLGENVNRFYPGDQYVDWVALNFYHHRGESITALKSRLDIMIKKLKEIGKPLMIGRFGSSGTSAEKARFFTEIMKHFKAWGIKAFIYFNYFETDRRGNYESFMIQSDQAADAYRQALKRLNLDGDIRTGNGELDRTALELPPAGCPVVEITYWTGGDARQIAYLENYARNRENYISSNRTPQVDNKFRLQLADIYRELARLNPHQKDKRKYLHNAMSVLKKALKSPDKSLVYHPTIKYVREYFEIMLKICDLYLELGKDRRALAWLRRANRELSNRWMVLAQNVSPDSVPGYRSRSHLIRAQLYERNGMYDEAARYYTLADDWATNQQNTTSIPVWLGSWTSFEPTLFWRGENISKLRFIAVKARLGLMRIALRAGVTQDSDNAMLTWIPVLKRAANILRWKELGQEKGGYMDLSFETLIYAMEASMYLSNNDLDAAKRIFAEFIPLSTLDGYSDLTRALRINSSLTSSWVDPWNAILKGLLQPDIRLSGEHLKQRLSTLREFSRFD